MKAQFRSYLEQEKEPKPGKVYTFTGKCKCYVACLIVLGMIALLSLGLNLTLLETYFFLPEPHECLATEDGMRITQGPLFPDFEVNVGET